MFLAFEQRQARAWQPLPYELIDRLSCDYGSVYCGELVFLERLGDDVLAYAYQEGRKVDLVRFAPDRVTLLSWPVSAPLRSALYMLLGSVSRQEPADYFYCPPRPGLQLNYAGRLLNGPRLWPERLSWEDVVRAVTFRLWLGYFTFVEPLGIPFEDPALVTFHLTGVYPPRPGRTSVTACLTYLRGLADWRALEKMHEFLRGLVVDLGLQPEHLQDNEYLRVLVEPPASRHELFAFG